MPQLLARLQSFERKVPRKHKIKSSETLLNSFHAIHQVLLGELKVKQRQKKASALPQHHLHGTPPAQHR